MGASLGKKGYVADINVTPFVDVMLVLLIIFMVTAPMMTEGLDVDLPQTQAVQSLPTDSDHVVLTVKKDGSLFLNEYRTPAETLATQLVAVVKSQNRRLFLQADKDVPYGVVVDIMGRVKAAGIEQMGLVAERVDDIAAPVAAPDNVSPVPDGASGAGSGRSSGTSPSGARSPALGGPFSTPVPDVPPVGSGRR